MFDHRLQIKHPIGESSCEKRSTGTVKLGKKEFWIVFGWFLDSSDYSSPNRITIKPRTSWLIISLTSSNPKPAFPLHSMWKLNCQYKCLEWWARMSILKNSSLSFSFRLQEFVFPNKCRRKRTKLCSTLVEKAVHKPCTWRNFMHLNCLKVACLYAYYALCVYNIHCMCYRPQ